MKIPRFNFKSHYQLLLAPAIVGLVMALMINQIVQLYRDMCARDLEARLEAALFTFKEVDEKLQEATARIAVAPEITRYLKENDPFHFVIALQNRGHRGLKVQR